MNIIKTTHIVIHPFCLQAVSQEWGAMRLHPEQGFYYLMKTYVTSFVIHASPGYSHHRSGHIAN
jgi:hypothetical protein